MVGSGYCKVARLGRSLIPGFQAEGLECREEEDSPCGAGLGRCMAHVALSHGEMRML